jgi:hypothetical protein
VKKLQMTVYNRRILKSSMGILNTIADLLLSEGSGSGEYFSNEVWYDLLFKSKLKTVSTVVVRTVDVIKGSSSSSSSCQKKDDNSQNEMIDKMASGGEIHCTEVLSLAWMIEKGGGSCLRVHMLYSGLKKYRESLSKSNDRGLLTAVRGKGVQNGNKEKEEVQLKVLRSEVEISASALVADLVRIAFKDLQELCQDGSMDMDDSAMTTLEGKEFPKGIKHHTDVSLINLATGVSFVRNATKGMNSSAPTLLSTLLA